MNPILLVEDDPDQLANYSAALRRQGLECATYLDAASALQASIEPPAMALLDVQLGQDRDAGFTLCQALIERFPNLPVVFLSSRTDEIDQIFGLRLGAWDYLTKPISPVLLTEKVRAVLRQAAKASQDTMVIESAGWRLDSNRLRLEFQGQAANLTVTEFSIVQALIQADGSVLSFDTLAEKTRQSIVTNNTLSTHIKHIRRKLKAIDPEFSALTSIYSKGYQWLG